MSGHTPGEWVFDPIIGDIRVDGKSVAAAMPANREANGPLIAAAPDLLEALRTMLKTTEQTVDLVTWGKFDHAVGLARAAIAKAAPPEVK